VVGGGSVSLCTIGVINLKLLFLPFEEEKTRVFQEVRLVVPVAV
jgi:hypothetical protein